MHRRHLPIPDLFVMFCLALLLVSVQSAYGQLRIVGSISGTVQDPTGAVVPNARVVLKDQQTGLTRESTTTGGDTRYNNLPGGAVNVTVDGINNASNGFKSGGTVFFVTVPVRVGAVDEITVETGGLTAESGAQSGANIKFTTKRGGESYHGSVFYEPQSERFNSNTWSRNVNNLPRLYNRTQNYGGNFGGPLLPFTRWKKKAFFFVNYERAYSPVRTARTITVLTAAAQQGTFTYLVSGT